MRRLWQGSSGDEPMEKRSKPQAEAPVGADQLTYLHGMLSEVLGETPVSAAPPVEVEMKADAFDAFATKGRDEREFVDVDRFPSSPLTEAQYLPGFDTLANSPRVLKNFNVAFGPVVFHINTAILREFFGVGPRFIPTSIELQSLGVITGDDSIRFPIVDESAERRSYWKVKNYVYDWHNARPGEDVRIETAVLPELIIDYARMINLASILVKRLLLRTEGTLGKEDAERIGVALKEMGFIPKAAKEAEIILPALLRKVFESYANVISASTFVVEEKKGLDESKADYAVLKDAGSKLIEEMRGKFKSVSDNASTLEGAILKALENYRGLILSGRIIQNAAEMQDAIRMLSNETGKEEKKLSKLFADFKLTTDTYVRTTEEAINDKEEIATLKREVSRLERELALGGRKDKKGVLGGAVSAEARDMVTTDQLRTSIIRSSVHAYFLQHSDYVRFAALVAGFLQYRDDQPLLYTDVENDLVRRISTDKEIQNAFLPGGDTTGARALIDQATRREAVVLREFLTDDKHYSFDAMEKLFSPSLMIATIQAWTYVSGILSVLYRENSGSAGFKRYPESIVRGEPNFFFIFKQNKEETPLLIYSFAQFTSSIITKYEMLRKMKYSTGSDKTAINAFEELCKNEVRKVLKQLGFDVERSDLADLRNGVETFTTLPSRTGFVPRSRLAL